jgi:hypothetical protein
MRLVRRVCWNGFVLVRGHWRFTARSTTTTLSSLSCLRRWLGDTAWERVHAASSSRRSALCLPGVSECYTRRWTM